MHGAVEGWTGTRGGLFVGDMRMAVCFCFFASPSFILILAAVSFLISLLPSSQFIHPSGRRQDKKNTLRSLAHPSRDERHGALLRHPLLSGHDVARLQLVLGGPFEAWHSNAFLDGGGGIGYGPCGDGLLDDPALGLRWGLDDEFVDQDDDDDDYYDED